MVVRAVSQTVMEDDNVGVLGAYYHWALFDSNVVDGEVDRFRRGSVGS